MWRNSSRFVSRFFPKRNPRQSAPGTQNPREFSTSLPATDSNAKNVDLKKAHIVSTEPLESKDSKWIQIEKIRYIDAAGRDRWWEFGSRKTRKDGRGVDAIGIIAIIRSADKSPEIVLQRQFRPPVGKICVEIPAGLLEPDETFAECAVRELHEETGFVGTVEECSGVAFNDPGFCNTSLLNVYVNVDMSDARNVHRETALEDGEFIEVFTVPLERLPETVEQLLQEGYAIDGRVHNIAAGIRLAKKFLSGKEVR